MMSFCGSQLWDSNLTWYTENPDFTRCFQLTALSWTPIAFLWLLVGIDLYRALKSSTSRNIPWNALNVTKIGLNLTLILIQILILAIQSFYEVKHDIIVYPAERWTPILRILTYGLVTFLVIFCKRHGIRSSGTQFLFWFLSAVCEAFAFRSAIQSAYDEPPVVMEILVCELLYYPIVLAAFVLNCWADAGPESAQESVAQQVGKPKKLSPEETSSFLSRLLFFWFEKLAWLGYKRPLETEDLWDLNPEDTSSELVPLFEKYWRQAREHAKVYEVKGGTHKSQRESHFKKKPASILPTLLKMFWPTLLLGVFLKFIQDVLVFASPQILKLLISYVEDKDAVNGDEVWKGYFYALLLLVTAMFQTLLLNQYFLLMFMAGMRVRTTLVNVIYRKSLIISSAARKESTTGEIVNLQSVDAQRFMDTTAYMNMIWSGPLQIGLSIYFLWGVLGPSVLAGLGVMILLIPLNAYIASKVEVLQIKQMKLKDSRIKQMNEILSGIKVLKLFAWENSYASQVMDIRDREMKVLKSAAYINAGTTFVWNCAPFLVAIASFASFVLSDPNNILDAQTAFVALSLFNVLRFPMAVLPMTISTLVQANVSLKRINQFMNSEEIDRNAVTHDSKEKDPIVVERGNFSWDPKDDVPLLKDINMRVSKGSLVAICGSVGSGKSSILSALLGEMFKKSGRVNTKGSLAYVAQQAWIQNASVRDNILFGLNLETRKYDKIVKACALEPDLKILAAGDRTEIGEKGINLSGGQKQRVSLARAVYNDADVYLLDDPLSAVDAHVGKQIFEQVLGPNGILKYKTRLLVTHAVTYLPQVDNIIVVKDGEITECGSYRELLNRKGAFAEFLMQHIASESDGEEDEVESLIIHDLEQVTGIKLNRTFSRTLSESDGDHRPATRKTSATVHESAEEGVVRNRKFSTGSGTFADKGKVDRQAPTPEDEKLIQTETTEKGNVQLRIYMHYLKAIGWGMTCITFVAYVVFQGLAVASDMWLSIWSNVNTGLEIVEVNGTKTVLNMPNQALYLGVYGGLGIGQGIGTLTASMVFAFASLRASNLLHSGMLERILRAPMSFFDTVPLGRIVNRFSKDVDVCDNTLRMNFETFVSCMLNVIAVLVVISYSTPIFMVVIIPIGILYFFIQRFYVATIRQLKRLESVSRSPIYSHFSETLTGCTTIRAFAVQQRFRQQSEAIVDKNQMCYYPSLIANRWLAVRLETIGNFIIFFSAFFAVLGRDTLSPGLVGLSISYALEVTQVLNWMVRMSSALETDIVAVERIQEYSHVAQEAPWDVPNRKPPRDWPLQGEVVFQNYQTRYREGLDLVLRGIDCRIKPSEKVGVVGRTGAGKSSLTLALFRIIEATQGTIFVDGEDISKIGLHDLRSRLTIIPQDPILFSGSLRINLDPFNEYSDQVVWRALELAHLKTFAKGLTAGLQHEVAEGGENLSVGQRQLLCLARALLRKTKILVLDEATAAVDLETDDLIQQTIRTEFKDCTIVTIAHRLNTIMDSMRVLVLDKGEIREFDTPGNLLENKSSIFYGMAKDAGLV